MDMKQSKMSTNLQMDSLELSDVANVTSVYTTISSTTIATKNYLDSSNEIQRDARDTSSDQGKGQISNTQVNVQSQMSRKIPFDETACEIPSISAKSSSIAHEKNDGNYGAGLAWKEVQDVGLEPIPTAIASESTNSFGFKGIIFMIFCISIDIN